MIDVDRKSGVSKISAMMSVNPGADIIVRGTFFGMKIHVHAHKHERLARMHIDTMFRYQEPVWPRDMNKAANKGVQENRIVRRKML